MKSSVAFARTRYRRLALPHFKRTKLFEFVARCMAIGDEPRIP
jgi:hypothetical protein